MELHHFAYQLRGRSAARVHRVQKVQKVVVAPFGRRFYKKEARLTAGYVEGLHRFRSGVPERPEPQ